MLETLSVFSKGVFLLDGQAKLITSDKRRRRVATQKAALKFTSFCEERFHVLEPNFAATLRSAAHLHAEHSLSAYDAFVVASCFGTTQFLLSEDMAKEERKIQGADKSDVVKIIDPFIKCDVKY